MLYVSNKYTSLHSILCESEDTDEAYTVGAGFTLKDAVYLSDKDLGLSFKRNGIHFSAGDHRCIIVDGSVSGVKITLKIRTALRGYKYPYRVFPELEVFDLVEVLAE